MENEDKLIQFYKKINGFTGPLARTRFHWRTRIIARVLAAYTAFKKKGRKKDQVMEIAEEWRRMFGLNRFWKIHDVKDETAYCEICFDCSLEGTGDVEACHRLMEYDRALLKRIGGRLVVLESRANPEVKGGCKVAIRKWEDQRQDLIPAQSIPALKQKAGVF